MDIGKYIDNMIKEKGIKCNWVAEQVGINPKTFYWKLYNNSIKAEELVKIAAVLDLDLNSLKESL